MSGVWQWAAARSIGTSHLKAGSFCQDAWCCAELARDDYSVLAAIVSDGAGSAPYAATGSKVVCTSLMRSVRSFFAEKKLEDLTEEKIWEWVDLIRDRLQTFADQKGVRLQDYAATLVALFADQTHTVILHIGDGAVVVRKSPESEWEVPSWPYQGEFASTTTFITDKTEPRLTITPIDEPISDFAIFSDGIERLVLNYGENKAYSPFFDRMIAPLRSLEETGKSDLLSKALHDYLSSPKVCERTDDDKTLILGVRTGIGSTL